MPTAVTENADSVTPTRTVSLKDYFGAIKKKRDLDHAREEALRTERLSQARSERDGYQSRIEELKRLLLANQSAGVESPELIQKIDELQRCLDETERCVIDLSTPVSKTEDPDLAARLRALEALSAIGLEDAREVSNLSECDDLVRLASAWYQRQSDDNEQTRASGTSDAICLDNSGRIVSCGVRVGTTIDRTRKGPQLVTIRVPVRSCKTPFLRSFIPDQLDWLPPRPEETASESAPCPAVYIERESGRLAITFDPHEAFPSTGAGDDDAWGAFKRLKDPGEPPTPLRSDLGRSTEQRLAEKAMIEEWQKDRDVYVGLRNRAYASALVNATRSIPSELQQELNTAGGVIDLEADYSVQPMLSRVQSELRALAAGTTEFVLRESIPHSDRARDMVQSHWAEFLSIPWSSEIFGSLALLKYHVEKGEQPRFWCEQHEGHFGFRLRTRDHTWIVGECFISPQPTSRGARSFEVLSSRSANQVLCPEQAFFATELRVRSGAMFMRVLERRWE